MTTKPSEQGAVPADERKCAICRGVGSYGTPGAWCEWCKGTGKLIGAQPEPSDAPAEPVAWRATEVN